MKEVTTSVLMVGFSALIVGATPALAQDRPATAPATQERPATTQPATPERSETRDEKDSRQPVKDSWITMKVHAQFIPEDALDDSEIDVHTNNGVVTLTGTVPTAAGRQRAVAVAKAVDGVRSVEDRLRVGIADHDRHDNKPVGTSGRDTAREAGREAGEAGREAAGATRSAGKAVSDGWIKSKIYAQFLTEDALDHSDINLDVERGMVTLKGTVASAAGQSRAEQIAKATDGVKSVRNNLKVTAQNR